MNKAVKRIRVLLVDDHPIVRHGLTVCLGRSPSLEVVGEASEGERALELARQLSPDVVVTDVEMPRMDGPRFTTELLRAVPTTRVLVLSIHGQSGHVLRMIQAGAAGYMLKDSEPAELIRGIETVARGEPFFSGDLAQLTLNQVVRSNGTAPLTVREREVLIRIAEGLSNKEIAESLRLGVRTIETHRERAMKKLNIHSVAGLTKYALAQGWATLDPGIKCFV